MKFNELVKFLEENSNYNLVNERKFFLDVAKFINSALKTIDSALKNSDTEIKSGQVFSISVPIQTDVGNNRISLELAFFKDHTNRSKRRKLADTDFPDNVNKSSAALYIPPEEERNHVGRIEVYFNILKKNTIYEELPFEKCVNRKNGLHPFVLEVLRHELTHAYEDAVHNSLALVKTKSWNRFIKNRPENSDDYTDYKYKSVPYYEDDAEHNAFLMAELSDFIDRDPSIRFFILKNQFSQAVNSAIRHLTRTSWYENLNERDKQWTKKTAYTFLEKLFDNFSQK